MPGLACLQAVTGGFIAENPLTNRAQSWIFEARAPRYEKGERKNRGRGRRSLSLFAPPAPLPPRLLFVNSTRSSRIIQNGGHEKLTQGFLAEEKLSRLQLGYARSFVQRYLARKRNVRCH